MRTAEEGRTLRAEETLLADLARAAETAEREKDATVTACILME